MYNYYTALPPILQVYIRIQRTQSGGGGLRSIPFQRHVSLNNMYNYYTPILQVYIQQPLAFLIIHI